MVLRNKKKTNRFKPLQIFEKLFFHCFRELFCWQEIRSQQLDRYWYCSFLSYPYCLHCSPLTLWVLIPLKRGVLDTTLYDKVYQWLTTGRWFSPGTLDSSTNKTDSHDNFNTLKSGIKHHNPKPLLLFILTCCCYIPVITVLWHLKFFWSHPYCLVKVIPINILYHTSIIVLNT